MSKDAKDLIKKLIAKPEKRLNAPEALDHKWFKNFGKDKNKQFLKKRNLKAFKNYVKIGRMQQAALTAIAVQASPEHIKELKSTFQALDKNGDGTITFDELKAGLGHKESADSLMALLKSADTDNTGSIDYTQFIAATLDAQIFLRDDYLRTAFDMFDKDGSGKIDNKELIELIKGKQMGSLVEKNEIDAWIKEVDKNGDGEIDFDEF